MAVQGPRGPADRPVADPEAIRAAARAHAAAHTKIIRSARDGARLSTIMLPLFRIRTPNGYGLLTTIGRRTGKQRVKCVRAVRGGSQVFIVQLRPPEVAIDEATAVAAWVKNIRARPSVKLRLGRRHHPATVREPVDVSELAEARLAFVEAVHLFDYGECSVHLRGWPTRRKIRDLHAYWFDTGVPLIAELDR